MSSKEKKDIPFVIATHPESKAYFHEIATPKKIIKGARSTTSVSCAQCTKPEAEGVQLLRCSKCKISSYCSKDCQKKHWPDHKLCCVETKFSTPKLINNFISNPTFTTFIQISAILAFGLDKKPPVLDRPLHAQCHVWITPNITYIMGFATSSLSPSEIASGTEGMLQVKSFNVAPSNVLDRALRELWKNTTIQNAAVFPNRTVVVVDFHMNRSEQSVSAGVVIMEHALNMVREGFGFQLESAILPGKTNLPLTIEGCLDFINTHIRTDKRNQLLMRMHMTKEDVDEYKRIASESVEA